MFRHKKKITLFTLYKLTSNYLRKRTRCLRKKGKELYLVTCQLLKMAIIVLDLLPQKGRSLILIVIA